MKAHISHESDDATLFRNAIIFGISFYVLLSDYTRSQVFLFYSYDMVDGKHFRKTRSLRTQNKWYLGEKLHYFPYASFHALQPRNRN